jgi:DNA polymerase III epsilon subunit-like protein
MHRMIGVGAVRFRLYGHEAAIFQQLMAPQTPIPPDGQQVHGITDAMVRGTPTMPPLIWAFWR